MLVILLLCKKCTSCGKNVYIIQIQFKFQITLLIPDGKFSF